MTRLFSYVVDHDHGFAPNPSGAYCTLVKCKYGWGTYKNIVELAEENDWIVGTGGADLDKSAGHGKLIYAMRVDEKLPLGDYYDDARFKHRIDAKHDLAKRGRFALVSRHFFYFGRNAIDISQIPIRHLRHRFEKKGPGFRSDFSEAFISDFAKWLAANCEVGVCGLPCQPHSEYRPPKCPSHVRRKGCVG
jgi:hypothetical protein